MPCKEFKSSQASFFFALVYYPWSEWSEKNSGSPAVAGASHRPTFVGRRGFFSDLLTWSIIPKKNEAKTKDLKTIFKEILNPKDLKFPFRKSFLSEV